MNMEMRTSTKGMLSILHHEAIVLNRYKDIKGIWTIGAGVTHAAHAAIDPLTFTGELTIEQALTSFHKVLARYEQRVNESITRPMKQHVFDAFVSIDYNTGAVNRAGWARAYNAGRPDEDVANSIMQWRKPAAIIPRRRAEKDLFLFGKYGPMDVYVYHADSKGNINWQNGRTLKPEYTVALLEKLDRAGNRLA